jgi:hypothetical protein
MSAYDPAAEAARWQAMAADLAARSQQAAHLAEILRQAAEDPAEIERGREFMAALDRAEGGARARVFPWRPPAAWVRDHFLMRAYNAEREAASLLTSAANFREIAEAVRAG